MTRSTYLCICLSILSICLQSDLLLAKTPISKPTSQSSKSSFNKYPEYTRAAVNKLMELKNKYPNLKIYPVKSLKLKYPAETICPKFKQAPSIIVYLMIFNKVPENKEGESTRANGYIFSDKNTSENRKFSNISVSRAIEDANAADENRPAADKDRPVLYQYRVQFDPTTCKK